MRANRTNETALVREAQTGDPVAIEDLLAAYLPFVYTIVRRAMNEDPDVDDIVQETMLRACENYRICCNRKASGPGWPPSPCAR